MINVYTLGHGFMLQGLVNRVRLRCPMRFYVRENTMLDGRGLANLIQAGNFTVVDEATQIANAAAGEYVQEHLLCTDMLSLKDINQTAKWLGRQQHAMMDFKGGFGTLRKLTDDTYVYTTAGGMLTRLSDIQYEVDLALHPEEYTLHWSACRSFVNDGSADEIRQACTSSLSEPKGMAMRAR